MYEMVPGFRMLSPTAGITGRTDGLQKEQIRGDKYEETGNK